MRLAALQPFCVYLLDQNDNPTLWLTTVSAAMPLQRLMSLALVRAGLR